MGQLGSWGLGRRMGEHTSEQNCLLGPLARLPGKELQSPTGEPQPAELSTDTHTHATMPPRRDTQQTSIQGAQWDGVRNEFMLLFMPINAIFSFC